ncbi:MAG: hypothetical protein FJ388_05860 [Verrucomicrobia bacterium]|nr:hypothetical protein [Verrucomicrobiota bacterium]
MRVSKLIARRGLSAFRRRSGQTMGIMAVVMVGMLALVALIVDAGRLHANRRHAQRTADAAAQAGARELLFGNTASLQENARVAALAYAGLNAANTNTGVLVEVPPSIASNSQYAGSNGAVRVELTRPVETTFMRLLLRLDTVNVRATATAMAVPGTFDATILLLAPAVPGALNLDGNGSLSVPNGTVYVDSSSPDAVILNGNTWMLTQSLTIVGGESVVGNGAIIGPVVTGAPVMPDPLHYLPAPVLSDYPTSLDSGGTAANPDTRKITGNANVTINPGIYWGGISVSANATVHMNPGRYIIAGGGITVSGNGKVEGADVFIYNTRDPQNPEGAGAHAPVSIVGNGYTVLKAPDAAADSTYKGILIFNDRASTTPVTVHGNGGNFGDPPYVGYVYNKNGDAVLTGNGSFGSLGLIARTLKVNGNAVFTATDPSRTPDTRTVRLVE